MTVPTAGYSKPVPPSTPRPSTPPKPTGPVSPPPPTKSLARPTSPPPPRPLPRPGPPPRPKFSGVRVTTAMATADAGQAWRGSDGGEGGSFALPQPRPFLIGR